MGVQVAMPRKPTRAEIIETNAYLTQRCDSCELVVYADKYYGTFENMLTFKVEGGYGEYVDTIHPNSKEFEFHLCHKCAHKLMDKFFKHYDLSNWHPRTAEKFCNGWTPTDWSE
jgi:hypothetical protein